MIGIMADEGKPSRDVITLLTHLLEDISFDEDATGTREISGQFPGVGEVQLRIETVPMSQGGDIMLAQYAGRILKERGWSRMLYVTDLPLTAWKRPVLSQRATDHNAVLISLPALGALRAKKRLKQELRSFIEHGVTTQGQLHEGADPHEEGQSTDFSKVHTRVLSSRGRTLRLIAGMVRCNQPWDLFPVLSSSLAAIAATGGFGIFYGSIWKMADALPLLRLLLISILSVVAFTMWLIIHNRLWQRRHTQETRWREKIDNLATIGTIGMTVISIYVLALVAMLVASVVVIPSEYLEAELGRDVGFPTYISIAWLSASLGAMAGALGSNFDRDVEIRSATYNLREHQRRMQQGNYTDESRDWG